MKKILSIIGLIFCAGILALLIFFGYGIIKSRKLDPTSKAFVDESITAITTGWSQEEFLKRASPQLRDSIDKNKLTQIFNQFRQLGNLKNITETKGQATVEYTTKEGKSVTAAYKSKVSFETSNAEITTNLTQENDEWKITNFNVNSDYFLKK